MKLDGHLPQYFIEPALYILQVHGAMENLELEIGQGVQGYSLP